MLANVSVIIPAFNAQNFIGTAVCSALEQDNVNVEVVVIDDRSSDDTSATVQRLAEQDRRIRLVQNMYQQGPAGARNTGLEVATGEWIAVLDADDTMSSGRLSTMVEHARLSRCDVLADNLSLVDYQSKKVLGQAFDPAWMDEQQYLTLEVLLKQDWPGKHQSKGIGFLKPILSARYLANANVNYDEDIWSGEDLLFYARLLDSGAKFILLSEALYNYSLRPGSISSSWTATRQLIDVNARISKLGSAVGTGIDFHQRAQAFWYQQFSQSVKQHRLKPAVIAAIHLDPVLATKALVRAALKRVI